MSIILNSINSPEDIKKLDNNSLHILTGEIREFLIDSISKTGGHLASNLGVIELTLALHKVFDSPEDKIIWDVGHQSYVHKIITGRKDRFDTLRKYKGISGFPKTSESCHDSFNTGHSSTSISIALGMAKARDLKKEKHSVVAVIGDGALSGGLALEAMNHAGHSLSDMIVILNDNEMSISKNVGSLSHYLSRLRSQPFYFKVREDFDHLLKKIPGIGQSAMKFIDKAKGSIKYLIMPGIFFEELGFKYLGPIDGHNIEELSLVLSRAKKMKGPVLIHVYTQKGKGYSHAELKPYKFHGISPFEIETGEVKENNGNSFSEIFGKELKRLAEVDKNIVAITAAMPEGTGLMPFSKSFPDRFFDVGIAEQHAVTFAAGLAISGQKPVVAIYSTFLQRAYDSILHDVVLPGLHVVFAIDRAGIVGEDGETHQGLYDIAYLRHMPGITLMAPSDYDELHLMLQFALNECKGPIALRYPRGGIKSTDECNLNENRPDITCGRGYVLKEGTDISLIAIGKMVHTAINISTMASFRGINVEVINARFIKPLDSELIINSARKTGIVVTLEDSVLSGGFGSSVLELLSQNGTNNTKIQTAIFAWPDIPISHGQPEALEKAYAMDEHSLFKRLLDFLTESGRL